MSTNEIQRGWMIDCNANQCQERHRDHGRVFTDLYFDDPDRPTVNNHLVTPVHRMITVEPWRLDSECHCADRKDNQLNG